MKLIFQLKKSTNRFLSNYYTQDLNSLISIQFIFLNSIWIIVFISGDACLYTVDFWLLLLDMSTEIINILQSILNSFYHPFLFSSSHGHYNLSYCFVSTNIIKIYRVLNLLVMDIYSLRGKFVFCCLWAFLVKSILPPSEINLCNFNLIDV